MTGQTVFVVHTIPTEGSMYTLEHEFDRPKVFSSFASAKAAIENTYNNKEELGADWEGEFKWNCHTPTKADPYWEVQTSCDIHRIYMRKVQP